MVDKLFSWDLYIINPLLIVIWLVVASYLFYKNSISKQKGLFYLEISSFWIVINFLIQIITNYIDSPILKSFSSSTLTILLFLSSYFLYATILNPLALWLTLKLQSRRIWIWISLFSCFLSIMIAFLSNVNITSIIFISLFLAVGISAQIIYFLFFNEQFNERLFPVFSSIKAWFVVSFATFISYEIYSLLNLNLIFNHNSYTNWIIFSLSLVCLIICLVVSIFVKERKIKVIKYKEDIVEQLQRYDYKVLIGLIVMSFLITSVNVIIKSDIFELFLVSKLKQQSYTNLNVWNYLQSFRLSFVLGQLLLGYLFYKLVIKVIGIVKSISILTSLTMFGVILITFIHNIYLLTIMMWVFGLFFFVVFYLWFGIALMWDYRSTKVSVLSTFLTVTFLTLSVWYLVISICKVNNIGLFGIFKSVFEVINNTDLNKNYLFIKKITEVYYICCILIFCLLGIYLTIFIWTANYIIAEYMDLKQIKLKMTSLAKSDIQSKMITRLIRE
ncbi:MFS cation transporter [Mycoplasma mycoides]|uniref:MFS cation transporter n=1 Tax=Mycoplasma mycoides TaxID=2102 RepID=UPI0009B7E7EF|nr:MFS cation transporter [Mycoplasma mycoides]PTD32360.1 putative transmembrane protein [Mycoplasma mycoides subsp. mycoides B345/93]PTD33689.1 putative transmembrane protein [Mycoplasma mycoides subsp. mycoides PO-67]